MQQLAVRWGLFALLMGSFASRSPGQGFHLRLDTIGAGLGQLGRAIIQLDNGHYAISANGGWIYDSLYWSSTTNLLILDGSGGYVSVSHIDVPDKLTYNGRSRSMVQLPDGKFVIGGNSVDTSLVGLPSLYWFNASGLAITYAEIEALPQYIVRQMNKAHDDGFVLVGDALIGNDIQAFILKTDSAGQLEWSQLFGTTTYDDYFWSVEPAPEGTYYIGGVKGVGNNSWDPWLLRVDSLGNEIWSFTNGTQYQDLGQAHLFALSDGSFVYGSGRPTGNGTDQRPQLVKVDCTGSILWSQEYDVATHSALILDVQEIVPGGDLIACGYSTPINPFFDGFLCRTNSQGDSLWLRHYWYTDSIMNDGIGYFNDVTPTSDGGFAAVGVMIQSMSGNDPPGASQDVWVLKVDSLGCVEPGCDLVTGITAQVTNLKDALRVWPNPVAGGGSVTVVIALPEGLRKGALRLSLISADGKLVREEQLPAFLSRYSFPISAYHSGLYMLHLSTPDTWLSGTKLMIE
ncbi:MAG: T9SS type A sorting domain-containing protein [Flavobacteriales bacterium]|nr:T9SS type A sorting domain-containing protein [Flavobacteriales bacterium]